MAREFGQTGTYREMTKNRGWGTEMLSNVAVKNRVYGLVELDVTKAREYLRGYKEKTGETLSFTGWMIKCIGFHSPEFALGGITEKPKVVDGRTEVRECLSVTVMFDEDVVYGAPAARFVARLSELMQQGYGLAA